MTARLINTAQAIAHAQRDLADLEQGRDGFALVPVIREQRHQRRVMLEERVATLVIQIDVEKNAIVMTACDGSID